MKFHQFFLNEIQFDFINDILNTISRLISFQILIDFKNYVSNNIISCMEFLMLI